MSITSECIAECIITTTLFAGFCCSSGIGCFRPVELCRRKRWQALFFTPVQGEQVAQNMLSVAELPDVVLLCPAKQKACFVYLAYGNSIDLPFMYIVSLAKKSIIDIHEAIAQNADDNIGLKHASERYTPTDLQRSSFIPNGRTICWRNTAIGVTGCSYLISNIFFEELRHPPSRTGYCFRNRGRQSEYLVFREYNL